MDFEDIEQGGENQAGTLTKFYFGFCRDVKTWPTFPVSDEATKLEDLGSVTGPIVMNTGKRMFKVEIVLNSGEAKDEEVGEVGGFAYKNSFNLFVAKLDKKLRGFLRATLNEPVFLIVPDANGNLVMIGSDRIAAYRTAGGGTGTGNNEGRNGAGVSYYSYGPGPAPIYDGEIPLTEAS